ncbi:hypothetical protein Tco_1301576 [Tanacetum coccineum]
MIKQMNKKFNISHVAQSKRFVTLQKELSKVIKLSGAKRSSFGRDMQTKLQDVQDLLESAVIIDESAEGEKKKKSKTAIPALIQGEHQTVEEQPADVAKSNEIRELIVHNAEEKKEGIITVDDDSDEDDKQPLAKSFLEPLSQSSLQLLQEINLKGKVLLLKSHQRISCLSLKKEAQWAELKDQEKKSEEELMKLLNPATIKAQALKWEEHEEKKAKMLNEFNKCISERTYPLPITKISYVVNSSKTATIRITRDKDPLNLRVYPNFKLKMMGFSEWLEVLNQEKRLGLPPPPELATFGLTAEEKKRKRLEFIKEVFVTEDVRVDGMNRNLIPPPRVVPIDGLVIEEPESGIVFMNRNTNIAFQRESEFYLTPTVQLIRIQNQIRVDSEIANEMFRKMNYVIEVRDDCIEARETVAKNLDNLG